MALKFNAKQKNSTIDDIITNLAGTTGTGGTAVMLVYTGTQPSDADQATSGNLLGTISGIAWNAGTNGTATLTSAFNGTTGAAGTAGWARIETIGASGTYRLDGDVGTGATCVFQINNPIFTTSGGIISLLTASILMS